METTVTNLQKLKVVVHNELEKSNSLSQTLTLSRAFWGIQDTERLISEMLYFLKDEESKPNQK